MYRLTLLLLTVFLAACAPRISTDPIKDMTDKTMEPRWRIDAAKQAEREMGNDPKRIEALHKLVWDKGHVEELRIYAIDELIRIDEKDFREKLDRRIVLVPYGAPLDHIYRVGKERKWDDLTAMLVKRWAVPQHGEPDDERTERKWISELNPGRDVEAVVFDVFTAPPEKINDLQRVGAWALLNRIATKEQLIAALDKAPQSTALVIDLKAAAADLHTLPRHREGVKWLFFLRDPARSAFWQTVKQNVAKLTPQQQVNLEMRHLAVLPHLDAATLAADRDALYKQLLAEMAKQEHHLNSPFSGAMPTDYPQRLDQWNNKLSWGDLATMRELWRIVNDPAVRASLFAQADRDLRNKGAEHGGVIDIEGGQAVAKEYPPLLRVSHDRQFTPKEEMIQHCYTGLAHYHFHAQEHKNAEFAGPGKGDIETADRLDFNFLVFTFIDANRLNVDYYSPRGIVVDLGTITR